MNDSPVVSIVIPVYNEEATLDELVDRTLKACEKTEVPYEIILVDDGSKDKSRRMLTEKAEKNNGKVVSVLLNRNYGQHAAVMAGFASAEGDMIVTLDADLQNPPEEIPRLVEAMKNGADVVGTKRMNRQDTLFRRLASAIVNKAAQKATGVDMSDYGCMLRGYKRQVVDAMLQCHERSTFIPILANSFAHETVELEVSHAERAAGDSKYSLWKLINLQFDLLTSMTDLPLRLLSVLGVLISFVGIAFGVFLMGMRFAYGAKWAAEGVFTLFSVLFVFMGGQFVGMGLLGEYIGRIYNDVRARPHYFVEKTIGRKSS